MESWLLPEFVGIGIHSSFYQRNDSNTTLKHDWFCGMFNSWTDVCSWNTVSFVVQIQLCQLQSKHYILISMVHLIKKCPCPSNIGCCGDEGENWPSNIIDLLLPLPGRSCLCRVRSRVFRFSSNPFSSFLRYFSGSSRPCSPHYSSLLAFLNFLLNQGNCYLW